MYSALPTNSGSPVSLGSRDGHRACRKQPDARRDAPRPPSQSLPACRSRLPRRIAICNRQSTFPTWIPEHLIISVPAQRIVPCPAWAPTKHALHVSVGGKDGPTRWRSPRACFGFELVPGHLILYWRRSSMNRKILDLFSAGPFSRPVATWDTDIKS
jgi:hypothetical protein